MSRLELRLHPPLVWLVCAAGAWAVARGLPQLAWDFPGQRALGIALAATGALLGLAGLLQFRIARTTFDPHRPRNSSALVTTGLYGHSRNPMYLGLLLVLLALIAWWGNPLSLLAAPAFVAWMTRFQIRPEERILDELFGDEYQAYCRRVRRWL